VKSTKSKISIPATASCITAFSRSVGLARRLASSSHRHRPDRGLSANCEDDFVGMATGQLKVLTASEAGRLRVEGDERLLNQFFQGSSNLHTK
jgi:hypothetical protein